MVCAVAWLVSADVIAVSSVRYKDVLVLLGSTAVFSVFYVCFVCFVFYYFSLLRCFDSLCLATEDIHRFLCEHKRKTSTQEGAGRYRCWAEKDNGSQVYVRIPLRDF